MVPPAACFTHYGSWDAVTRELPTLAFIEKYTNKVDSLDISGPFHLWYAPSCTFYNTDGVVIHGGGETWDWMKGLFAPFRRVRHDVKVIRLYDATTGEAAPKKAAQWITLETQTTFITKGKTPAGDSTVIIPRLLMFLVGKSDVDGQGTDGMQILEAKVWWDTGVLQKTITAKGEYSG